MRKKLLRLAASLVAVVMMATSFTVAFADAESTDTTTAGPGYKEVTIPGPFTDLVVEVEGLTPGDWDDIGNGETRAEMQAALSIAYENAQIIQAALDEVGEAGGGTVVLPEGTYCIASQWFWEDWADFQANVKEDAALKINYDNITLTGAGKNDDGTHKTVLKTNFQWDAVQKEGTSELEEGSIIRGCGIEIYGTPAGSAAPRQNIVITNFELDGGRGWTDQYDWGYDPWVNYGWDVYHKGITVSWDSDGASHAFVSNVYLHDLNVHSFSGETLYVGGRYVGYLSVSDCVLADTNASCFNLYAASLYVNNTVFGGADTGCRFWIEIAPRQPHVDEEAINLPEGAKFGYAEFTNCEFYNAAGAHAIAIAQGDSTDGSYELVFDHNYFSNAAYKGAPSPDQVTKAIWQFGGGIYGPTRFTNNIVEDSVGPALIFDYGSNIEVNGVDGMHNLENRNVYVEGNVFNNMGERFIDLTGTWMGNYAPTMNLFVRDNVVNSKNGDTVIAAIGNAYGGNVEGGFFCAAMLLNVVFEDNTFNNCVSPMQMGRADTDGKFYGNAPLFRNNTYNNLTEEVQTVTSDANVLRPLYENLIASAAEATTATLRTRQNEDGQKVTVKVAEDSADITFSAADSNLELDEDITLAAGESATFEYKMLGEYDIESIRNSLGVLQDSIYNDSEIGSAWNGENFGSPDRLIDPDFDPLGLPDGVWVLEKEETPGPGDKEVTIPDPVTDLVVEVTGLVEGDWDDIGNGETRLEMQTALTTAYNNAQIIQAAIDEVGEAGGGTVVLPEGTYCIASQWFWEDWADWEANVDADAALKIRHDNITLTGSGKNADGTHKTVLKTNFQWDAVRKEGTNELEPGSIVRGCGIEIFGTPMNSDTPRQNIVIKEFELDGGRGWTDQYDWGYDPWVNYGWDVLNKGITVSWDRDGGSHCFVSNVYLHDLNVHSFSGETLYVGGRYVGYLSVSDCVLADTNASCFNLYAASLYVNNTVFGGADTGCRFWIEIAPRQPHVDEEAINLPEGAKYGYAEFTNCEFYNAAGAHAIAIAQGDSTDGSYELVFDHNYFSNKAYDGEEDPYSVTKAIWQFGGGIYGPTRFTNNIVEDSLGPALTFDYGSNIEVNGKDGMHNLENRNVYVEGNVFNNMGARFLDFTGTWMGNYAPTRNIFVRNNTVTSKNGDTIIAAIGNSFGGTVLGNFYCASMLLNVVVEDNTFNNCVSPTQMGREDTDGKFYGNAPLFQNNTYNNLTEEVQTVTSDANVLRPLYERLITNAEEATTATLRTRQSEDGQKVTVIVADDSAPITFSSDDSNLSISDDITLQAGESVTFEYKMLAEYDIESIRNELGVLQDSIYNDNEVAPGSSAWGGENFGSPDRLIDPDFDPLKMPRGVWVLEGEELGTITTTWELNEQIANAEVDSDLGDVETGWFGANLGAEASMTITEDGAVRGVMVSESDADKPQFVFTLPETVSSGVVTAELDMMIEEGTSIWWTDFGFGKSDNNPMFTTPQAMIGDNEHRIDWGSIGGDRAHAQGTWYHYVLTVDLDAQTTTLVVSDANGTELGSWTKAFNTANNGIDADEKGQTGIVDQFIIVPHANGANAGAYQVKNVEITIPGYYDNSFVKGPEEVIPSDGSWALNDQIADQEADEWLSRGTTADYSNKYNGDFYPEGDNSVATIQVDEDGKYLQAQTGNSDEVLFALPQIYFGMAERYKTGVLTATLDLKIDDSERINAIDMGFGYYVTYDGVGQAPNVQIANGELTLNGSKVADVARDTWYTYTMEADLIDRTVTVTVTDANGDVVGTLTEAMAEDITTLNMFKIKPTLNGDAEKDLSCFYVRDMVVAYENGLDDGEVVPPPVEEDKYTVSGTVTSAGDEAVTVSLLNADGEVVASAAAADGAYSIADVAAGTYTVEVSAENHVTRTYEVTVDADAVLDVEIWLIGDVNGDGVITVVDANLLYGYYCDTTTLEDYAVACGDLDADGSISVMEVNAVYAHYREASSLWN